MIFAKLQMFYISKNLTRVEDKLILNLLSEIQLKIQGISKKAKSRIIDSLKKLKREEIYKSKE